MKTTCSLCSQPLLAALTPSGNAVALEPEPAEQGAFMLIDGRAVLYEPENVPGQRFLGNVARYRCHGVGCKGQRKEGEQ
jgi:hypothetical protein